MRLLALALIVLPGFAQSPVPRTRRAPQTRNTPLINTLRSVSLQLPESWDRGRFPSSRAAAIFRLNMKSAGKPLAGLPLPPELAQMWAGLGPNSPATPLAQRFQTMAEDIDEVIVSVGITARGEPDPLILLSGRFAGPHWRETLPKGALGTLHEDNTILIGQPAAVASAVSRIRNENPPTPNALLADAASVATHDLWVVADPSRFGGRSPDGIRKFVAGLSMGEKLNLDMTIHTVDGAAADRILAAYRQAEPNFAQVQPELIKGLVAAKTADGVRFQASIAQDTIADLMRMRMDPTPVAAKRSRPAPPPGPRKVVIYGMEGGPKEIPYQ